MASFVPKRDHWSEALSQLVVHLPFVFVRLYWSQIGFMINITMIKTIFYNLKYKGWDPTIAVKAAFFSHLSCSTAYSTGFPSPLNELYRGLGHQEFDVPHVAMNPLPKRACETVSVASTQLVLTLSGQRCIVTS